VCPSVVSVAGGFCVVSGRGVMLGMGMSITDSSYMLIMVVVKAMDASIDLVGTFIFVACRSVHVMFTTLLVGCLGISWLSSLCLYRPV
jgi:hypothetical protein